MCFCLGYQIAGIWWYFWFLGILVLAMSSILRIAIYAIFIIAKNLFDNLLLLDPPHTEDKNTFDQLTADELPSSHSRPVRENIIAVHDQTVVGSACICVAVGLYSPYCYYVSTILTATVVRIPDIIHRNPPLSNIPNSLLPPLISNNPIQIPSILPTPLQPHHTPPAVHTQLLLTITITITTSLTHILICFSTYDGVCVVVELQLECGLVVVQDAADVCDADCQAYR